MENPGAMLTIRMLDIVERFYRRLSNSECYASRCQAVYSREGEVVGSSVSEVLRLARRADVNGKV
jgi:hypothetical protein